MRVSVVGDYGLWCKRRTCLGFSLLLCGLSCQAVFFPCNVMGFCGSCPSPDRPQAKGVVPPLLCGGRCVVLDRCEAQATFLRALTPSLEVGFGVVAGSSRGTWVQFP
jgi:hypothetical protein